MFHRQRSAFQPGRQRFALRQLHDQVVGPDVVERADVRVGQRGNRARFALEPRAELLLRDLDRNGAAQPRVDGARDVAHTAVITLRSIPMSSERFRQIETLFHAVREAVTFGWFEGTITSSGAAR